MKRFRGQISCIFHRQVLLYRLVLALTTKSIIMLNKIVHRTRDRVGIIVGVQHIDGPLQVKYWGGPYPCYPCGVDDYAKNRSVPAKRWYLLLFLTTETVICSPRAPVPFHQSSPLFPQGKYC